MRRKKIIEKIIKTLKEVHDKGLKLDEGRFRAEICRESNCTWRTAGEYIMLAKDGLRNET